MDTSKPFESSLLLSDEEIARLGVKPSDFELYRRKHYQASFGVCHDHLWTNKQVSTWYKELKQHTFKTKFMSLTPAEGHILASVNPQQISSEEEALLKDLERRIDANIQAWFPDGCFLVRFLFSLSLLDSSDKDENLPCSSSCAFLHLLHSHPSLYSPSPINRFG